MHFYLPIYEIQGTLHYIVCRHHSKENWNAAPNKEQSSIGLTRSKWRKSRAIFTPSDNLKCHPSSKKLTQIHYKVRERYNVKSFSFRIIYDQFPRQWQLVLKKKQKVRAIWSKLLDPFFSSSERLVNGYFSKDKTEFSLISRYCACFHIN